MSLGATNGAEVRIDSLANLVQYRAMSAPVTACERCGTFAERTPFWGSLLCGECIDRMAAKPLTLSSLHAAFWAMFRRVGGRVIGLQALCNLPIAVMEAVGEKGIATDLLGWFVPAYAGAFCAYLAVGQTVSGRPVRLVEAVAAARARFMLLALSYGAALLISGLFAFLLIVPGIMRLLSYALVTTIAVCDPVVEPLDVLQRSQVRMKGHRWIALVAYGCAGAAALAPGALVTAFVAGRDLGGATRLLTTLASGLGTVLGGITTLVSATLYVELTRPDLWPVSARVGGGDEDDSTS